MCPLSLNPSFLSFIFHSHTHTHTRPCTSEEYLYRFVALAAGGWAAGPWQRGRSRSKGKPRLVSLQAVAVWIFGLLDARVLWREAN